MLADIQIRAAMIKTIQELAIQLEKQEMPVEVAPSGNHAYYLLRSQITDFHAGNQQIQVFGAVVVSEDPEHIAGLWDGLREGLS